MNENLHANIIKDLQEKADTALLVLSECVAKHSRNYQMMQEQLAAYIEFQRAVDALASPGGIAPSSDGIEAEPISQPEQVSEEDSVVVSEDNVMTSKQAPETSEPELSGAAALTEDVAPSEAEIESAEEDEDATIISAPQLPDEEEDEDATIISSPPQFTEEDDDATIAVDVNFRDAIVKEGPPNIELVIEAFGAEKYSVLLDAGQDNYVLGRKGKAGLDVEISDISVSGRHCEFRWHTSGGWTVGDLGTTNGTQFNGEKLTGPVSLGEGCRIIIGETTIYPTVL